MVEGGCITCGHSHGQGRTGDDLTPLPPYEGAPYDLISGIYGVVVIKQNGGDKVKQRGCPNSDNSHHY